MSWSTPIVEAIARIEHEQWITWAKHILETEPGISMERKERWQKLFIPYEELSEEWKEYDREWARKVLWRVGAGIADFLEAEEKE